MVSRMCSCCILMNCLVGIVLSESFTSLIPADVAFWIVMIGSYTIKEDISASLSENTDASFELLLQEIMIKSLHAYKCVAIVSDTIYSDLFEKHWFVRFRGFISYILVNVEESEDLLAPNNETQNSLMMAKNDGCQMYIILIANGLQAARLLKFGDRNIATTSFVAWAPHCYGYLTYVDNISKHSRWKEIIPKKATHFNALEKIINKANEAIQNVLPEKLKESYEKYRVLDTRANYILLFDNRLFDKKIFYLWKRIINVVFIRKYTWKKSNKGKGKNFWYEITTVPFPTNFVDMLIPKRLDIWAELKFRKGADFFKDKTSDLKNQTLKVAAFPHIPGTVRQNSSFSSSTRSSFLSNNNEFYSGTELEILKTVSQSMNFHCEVYEPENADIELWGKKQVGGIYTGLLGEMTSARADLALGDLYYIPFMLEIMDLSIPYNTECLTFITPESLTDISWKTLILPFSPMMWGGVILCLVISSICFYCLARFHLHMSNVTKINRKNNKNRVHEIELKKKQMFVNLSISSQIVKLDSDLKYSMLKEQYQTPKDSDDPEGLYQFTEPVNSILYTYSMLLLVSLPKLPTGWSLRVLTGWYWLYCLLVVVAYRASMTAILSRPTIIVTINTLQELVDSRLTYEGWGEINKQFFASSIDSSIRKIVQNFQIANNSDDAIDRVAGGQCAFYENTYFLKEAVVKRQTRYQEIVIGNQTNQTGIKEYIAKSDRNLHIMKDCIINMPVSIGLQKNSPLKPRVDKFIRRVLEGGLVKKWLNDVMQIILIDKVDSDEGQKALMNLKKMYGALVVLGIGYVLGLLVLAGELLYFHYYVVKNPGYNKYSRRVHEIKKIE